MTGAIEFMKEWQNICMKQIRCYNCPIEHVCNGYSHSEQDEDDITELVRAVMAEARKKVDAE